jgi:hypothetical protein
MKRAFLSSIVLSALVIAVAFMMKTPVRAAAAANTGCLAHHFQYIEGKFEVEYEPGCTGHDEPELDPVSAAPGSARDLTWTVVLPTDGSVPVSAVGPTFWFGGVVSDPKSFGGQSFVELQFYPDSIVSRCFVDGAFAVSHSPNTYSACSPVFRLSSTGQKGKFRETAAFNAMLTDGTGPSNPLIMHAGDTITVHWFVTPQADGFHVTVTDLTTGGSGTIVLNASDVGPLMPAFDTQELGNSLAWGLVNDTPNAFVWEIGHEDIYTGGAALCVGGQTTCGSYNSASWAGFSPIKIQSVTFGDGSAPTNYAVVSDTGGEAEILATCSKYGGPFCIYPWYTLGKTGNRTSFHYGVDYPNTFRDFGQGLQFQQTLACGGPFGPNSTYCATILQ